MIKPILQSPQGPGRPAEVTRLPLEVKDFSAGINVYYDSLAATTPAYFAVNARALRGRSLSTRLGYQVLGDLIDGEIYMLGTHKPINSQELILRILGAGSGVTLEKYADGTGWSTIATFGSTADKTDFTYANVIFNNEARTYFTNGVSPLMYTDGTTIHTVDNDGVDVKAKHVVAVQNILVLGNMQPVSGVPHGVNDVIWSKAGTHQFRRDTDIDYAHTSNKVTMDSEITGLASIGWLVYIFTRYDGLWELDLSTAIPRRISTHSTVAPRSIAVGHDGLIWADYDGIWLLTPGGGITKVSDPIDEIYKNIDFSNFENISGLIDSDGKYRLYVGDITFEGETYNDAVIVLDLYKSRASKGLIWWFDTKKQIYAWINRVNNVGHVDPYFADSKGNVYLDEIGHTDNGDSIPFIWQSKDFELADVDSEITLQDIYLKVDMPSQDIRLKIEARFNKKNWLEVKTFTIKAGSGLEYIRIPGVLGGKGRAVGIRLSSTNLDTLQIHEMIVKYNVRGHTIRPVSYEFKAT